MRKNIVSICVLALLLVTFSVFGQEDRNKGNYQFCIDRFGV